MSNLGTIEKAGEENQKLARNEKIMSSTLKSIAISELKRSKVRKKLGKEEQKLADLRNVYVGQYLLVADSRLTLKDQGLIEFTEVEFLAEKEQSDYFKRIAEIQIKVSEITTKQAEIEAQISNELKHIASNQLKLATTRKNLGLTQKSFVKFHTQNSPGMIELDHNLKKKKEHLDKKLVDLQHKLYDIRNLIVEGDKKIFALENNLAILIRALSVKLGEREKAR